MLNCSCIDSHSFSIEDSIKNTRITVFCLKINLKMFLIIYYNSIASQAEVGGQVAHQKSIVLVSKILTQNKKI